MIYTSLSHKIIFHLSYYFYGGKSIDFKSHCSISSADTLSLLLVNMEFCYFICIQNKAPFWWSVMKGYVTWLFTGGGGGQIRLTPENTLAGILFMEELQCVCSMRECTPLVIFVRRAICKNCSNISHLLNKLWNLFAYKKVIILYLRIDQELWHIFEEIWWLLNTNQKTIGYQSPYVTGKFIRSIHKKFGNHWTHTQKIGYQILNKGLGNINLIQSARQLYEVLECFWRCCIFDYELWQE